MKILIGLAVLIGAGAAVAAGLQAHRMAMMKHMVSARIEEAEDYIDATPQQRVAIEQSKPVVFKAFAAKAQSRQADHDKLIDALTADQFDANSLYAFADQRAQDIQDMAKVIVPELQKIHDQLTPAQRQKLAQKAQEMQQKHMQRGFGGPPEE